MGFTRPMSPKHSGYMGNIYLNSRDVKIEGVPFSDAFEEKNSGPFGYTTRHFHPMLEPNVPFFNSLRIISSSSSFSLFSTSANVSSISPK